MRVKANVSFAGVDLNMHAGQIKECVYNDALQSLIDCGYIEEVKAVKNPDITTSESTNVDTNTGDGKKYNPNKSAKKGGKKDESK